MDSASLDAEGAVLSAVADVQMLAEAAALVGGISAFTRLAHRLGTSRIDTPMIFVDVATDAVQSERASRWARAHDVDSDEPTPTEAHGADGDRDKSACPHRDDLLRDLDLDGDEILSDCEANMLYKPLAQVGHSLSILLSPTPSPSPSHML